MAIVIEGTRLMVLDFIQKQRSATIRRHLDILRGDRLVTYDQVREVSNSNRCPGHLGGAQPHRTG
jgi:hypothetical protein